MTPDLTATVAQLREAAARAAAGQLTTSVLDSQTLLALCDAVAERDALRATGDEVEQILGKALGYPWLKDDPVNFPNATEADGVCVGEHVPETLAEEAAKRIGKLRAKVERYEAALNRIAAWPMKDGWGDAKIARDVLAEFTEPSA